MAVSPACYFFVLLSSVRLSPLTGCATLCTHSPRDVALYIFCWPWPLSPVQEAIEQAQRQGEDGDEAEQPDGDADKEEKESNSSFGGFGSDSDSPPKRRRTAPASGPPPAPQQPSRHPAPAPPAEKLTEKEKEKLKEKEKVEKPQSRAAKARVEKAERTLAAAQKAYKSLEEISVDMLWRSVIRVGEVERRLQKSSALQSELEALLPTGVFDQVSLETVKGLLETMGPHRTLMSDVKDLCREIRTLSSEDMAKAVAYGEGELVGLFRKCFYGILTNRDQGTVIDMLCTLAKRLHEVSGV